MADNILKLKVDSTEYDAKLKRASDGLTRYVEGCRKAGGTLEVVEKDTLAYVKALGNMETTSRTAKGRLAEMSKAFLDLSMQYKSLTNEEKSSPFGKALTESLDTLKGRIVETKRDINELGKQIGELPTGTKAVGGLGLERLASGLDNISGMVTGGMAGLSGMLGKAGPWGAAAAAAVGFGDALVTVGKSAIDARRNIENLELNIGTLLGSAEKGKQMVAQLAEYGQKTPYDTEGLAGAARTLLAYGVNAERIMPIMRQLGDVAQGNTQNLQSLALAFGQMTAVGTVQKQDLNQMANAGFGFNQIAKSMNISVAEFLEMVSKKKVSVDDIAKALQDATSAGGLFYNSALNASQGLEGTFSNMEESLTSTKAKFGALIEPAVIAMVQQFGNSVEGLTSQLGGSKEAAAAFTTIGKGLGAVMQYLTTVIGDVVNVGRSFGSILGELSPIVTTVTTYIGGLISKALGLQGAFDKGNSSVLVRAVRDLFQPLKALNDRLQVTLKLIRAARQAVTGEPSKLPRTYSGYHGYNGDRVRVALNVMQRQGQAKYDQASGEYTDMQGHKIGGTYKVKVGGKARRATREFDVANNRWYWQLQAEHQSTLDSTGGGLPSGKKKKKKKKKGGHTSTTKTEKTEEQLNNDKIKKLQEEYVKLKEAREAAAKVNDTKSVETYDAQLKSINEQIVSLQAVNDKIKQYQTEAKMKPITFDVTAIPKIDLSQYKQEIAKEQALTPDHLSKMISDLNKQINQSEIGSAMYNKLTEKLKDANTFKDVLQIAIQNGIDLSNPDFSKIWNEALNSDNISDDDLQKLVDDINQKLADKGLGQISIKTEGGASLENPQPTEKSTFEDSFSSIKEGWSDISGIGDGIQSMTQALEGNANGWEKLSAIINGFIHISDGIMGVVKMINKLSDATKAAGAVSAGASKTAAAGKTAEASANAGAATTAAADTMASATAGAAKLPFPANIAAIAAAIAATVGIIATIASLTKGFHHGGVVHAALGAVVPGTNYSGDMVPAMLNSGELVLNQAQQGNLASQLASAGSFRDLRLGMDVDGDVLRLVLNNNGRRTGKGELVTSNIKLW